MVSLWMDIISAMDRSAKDRFSWNSADIIVVSSWKIPATFWAGKIFIYSRKFKNHAGKAILEVVWGPYPPFSSGNWGRWQPFCGRMPANALFVWAPKSCNGWVCSWGPQLVEQSLFAMTPPPRLSWRREGGVTARLAAVCTGGDKRERPSPPVFLHMSCA